MQLAPIPFDEAQRLEAVHRSGILNSDPEERFDRITRIAHHLFDIPFVYITLVDHDRIWIKSNYGCDVSEGPRDVSFCGHAICNRITEDLSSRLFEVTNAEQDERFYDNSLIIEKSNVRYYLGFVIQSRDHRNIGTLCMNDSYQRTFSSTQKKLFIDLGLMAEAEINSYRIGSPAMNSNVVSQLHSGNNTRIDSVQKKKQVIENLNTTMNSQQGSLLDSLSEEEKEAFAIFLKNFPTDP